MGFFNRLLGIEDDESRRQKLQQGAGRPVGAPNDDASALERYRYMLRTAPPETLEQAHAEAFAKLTPEQRRQVLAQLTEATPPAERAVVAATPIDDPHALGRVATRAEIRQPGLLERSLGGGGGMGFGTHLLSSFAMGFVGSMVAQSFFSALGGFGDTGAAADEPANQDDEALADNEADAGDDLGGDDFGGDDFEI
jgi:hypothetical protein